MNVAQCCPDFQNFICSAYCLSAVTSDLSPPQMFCVGSEAPPSSKLAAKTDDLCMHVYVCTCVCVHAADRRLDQTGSSGRPDRKSFSNISAEAPQDVWISVSDDIRLSLLDKNQEAGQDFSDISACPAGG